MGERAADDADRRDPAEAEALMERTVRRMLGTPPRPQKDMKLGRPRGRKPRPGSGEVERKPAHE